jgi:hypothetical protein
MNSELTLAFPNLPHVYHDFWNLAYHEIDEREAG